MGCRLAEGYLPYKRFLLEQVSVKGAVLEPPD